jgi:hypothetical protein
MVHIRRLWWLPAVPASVDSLDLATDASARKTVKNGDGLAAAERDSL